MGNYLEREIKYNEYTNTMKKAKFWELKELPKVVNKSIEYIAKNINTYFDEKVYFEKKYLKGEYGENNYITEFYILKFFNIEDYKQNLWEIEEKWTEKMDPLERFIYTEYVYIETQDNEEKFDNEKN